MDHAIMCSLPKKERKEPSLNWMTYWKQDARNMAVFLCLTIILYYTSLKVNCQHDHHFLYFSRASLVAHMVKTLPAMQETWGRSLGQEDLLEKGMATHSSILAWRIPWTEKPGEPQSMGSQRVRHDWATNTSLLPFQVGLNPDLKQDIMY